MKALFLAMGPAVKANVTFDNLDNVQVYQLVCHILGVTPNPHNGTADFWAPYTLNRDRGRGQERCWSG